MPIVARAAHAMVLIAVIATSKLVAQQPPQFKANVRMTDGSDGSTSTGTMYFGGAKMRTELTKDGQSIVVLADPVAKSQVILMPTQKVYMQMPIGQGPVSVPITGPSDPTNPCTGASGYTDCVKGPNVSVSGYATVQWDYTNAEGVRGRVWVSTQLRFPVKAQDDNGSSMELSNIAEGAQAASLFGIPAGYTKMDVGAMGGRGRASRANASDPVASAMGNLSPGATAALAAARRGEAPKGTVATAGSAWEKGNGWVLSLTITGTSTTTNTRNIQGAIRETYSAKYVASIPLNYGTPGAGVVGAPGPMWTHLVGAGGSAAVLAKPLTVSVEAESRAEQTSAGNCAISEDPFTAVTMMKNTAQRSGSMQQPSADGFMVQAVVKLSPDLKTYDLMTSFQLASKESEQKKIDGKGCRSGQTYTKNETNERDVDYGVTIEINGVALPSSVSTITGTKKMPMTLGGHQMDATVAWTLTPVR